MSNNAADSGNSGPAALLTAAGSASAKQTLRAGVALLGLLLSACGASAPGAAQEREPTGKSEQFVYWEPSAALVTEHVNWHQPCGTIAGSRSCSNMGQQFLVFHHEYVQRLRDNYLSQGLAASSIEPWYSLPPEMKNTANGWTTALQTAENNILALRNAAGQPFASLNEFGLYVENSYHNALHGIAATAYGGASCTATNTDCIVKTLMSPKSTYFFKIHGLIDWHMKRFLQGDFNRDGKGDIFVRNTATGANEMRLLNGTTTASTAPMTAAGVDACNWYVGAAADFNYDGWNDLVWHGPGCGQTSIWQLNGTTISSNLGMQGVGSEYTMVGAGDFNRDGRPDIVWRQNTGDIHIWFMNGINRVSGAVIPYPSGNAEGVYAVADFNDDGSPDFLVRRFVNDPQGGATFRYYVQYMNRTTLGTLTHITNMGSIAWPGGLVTQYYTPMAVGRYNNDRYVDLAWFADAPVGGPRPYQHFFYMWDGVSMTDTARQTTGGNDQRLRGPH
jgi:hypothetical protein